LSKFKFLIDKILADPTFASQVLSDDPQDRADALLAFLDEDPAFQGDSKEALKAYDKAFRKCGLQEIEELNDELDYHIAAPI
jgi:hypothetical protein